MGEESQRDVLRMEYVYKEYVRLHEVANAYAHSSFDDFKLLAAVGLILTWAPFGSLFTGETASPEVLFLGFVAILLIIAIIGTRDFLKQSLIIHYQQRAATVRPGTAFPPWADGPRHVPRRRALARVVRQPPQEGRPGVLLPVLSRHRGLPCVRAGVARLVALGSGLSDCGLPDLVLHDVRDGGAVWLACGAQYGSQVFSKHTQMGQAHSKLNFNGRSGKLSLFAPRPGRPKWVGIVEATLLAALAQVGEGGVLAHRGLPKGALKASIDRICVGAEDRRQLLYRIIPEATYKRRRETLSAGEFGAN